MSNITDKQRLAMKLSDQILELIDASADMTRGDLQGCTEALASQLIDAVKARS